MTPQLVFPLSEIRGRMIHEKLLAEARSFMASHDWENETCPPSAFPAVVCAGGLRPAEVAG